MDGLTATAPAGAAPTTSPFPLTDLQQGYLVGTSDLIELGGFLPNYYVDLDVVDLDPARARTALARLVRHHEHLRTVALPDGTQRVLADDELTAVALPVTDLTGLPRRQQLDVLAAEGDALCERGVDPTRWPLFEVRAYRIRPHRFRVRLAMSLLLLDGRSIRQLIREWRRCYADPDTDLPAASLTFRDCRLAQLAEEDSAEHAEHLAYWRDRLDTLPEAPILPVVARPDGDLPIRFTRRHHLLDADRWRRFREAAQRHRVLPSTALLHVFAETLGAWAAAPHFCLNVLHQGWTTRHPETAGVVGQLGATLALEIDLRRDDGFWDRARRSQAQLWRDMQHSDVSAVQVMREVAAHRGWTPRAALPYVFTSMLAPGGTEPETDADRLACRMVDSALRTPQVLVDNQIQDTPDGGIACVFDTVDPAFPAGLPDMLLDAYVSMLDAICAGAEPDAARDPDPVPEAHRRLVAAVNATDAPVPHGRLEDGPLRQARARPDAPAVLSARRTLTYGQLDHSSRHVAAWLREQGAGCGDVVPVLLPKGWEQVVAVLGVLRAGAAYCPIDARTPPERIRYLVEQCDARAVLTRAAQPLPDGVDRPALAVDRLPDTPAAEPPRHGGGHRDIAYVIYTSGSTGVPKGVVIDHRGALNTLTDINRRVRLRPADRVFGVSSLSFDLSVWDVFGTLAAGAALVLPDADPWPDPAGWATTAARYSVTVWNSVPALAEMLVEIGEQRADLPPPPVRAFLLSGDWIPVPLPDRIRRLWSAVRILAMGGATEASIWSNSYEVRGREPGWDSVPYGRPLLNQTMRVLDHRLDVRPPWAVGQIHIGGVGLARGYWRDDVRTAERFITHPRTGERLYRTGDLGRYRPDGTIEFLGRQDRQVKIQGFRVEPGEIEAALRPHPAVQACTVVAEDAPGGQRRLVALAVAAPGQAPDPATLIRYLRDRLPSYLVPGRLHLVRSLPLTANGKVDVAAALATVAEAPVRHTAADNRDPFLERLRGLWGNLLELPDAGPDADFFALGGNSLLALRLVHRLRADLGREVPFRAVFESPTPRALADRLGHEEPRPAAAVTLAEREGTPLFLFHPVGGAVTSYVELARRWPGPVVAFADDPTDGADDPDLESMAARYRAELWRRAPGGPYRLGGWSMGGILAYEVGRQLAAAGRPARIFMIDSTVTGHRRPSCDLDRHREFLGDLAGGRLPAPLAEALAVAGPLIPDPVARDLAVADGLLPPEVDAAGYGRLRRVHTRNLGLLAGYRPGPSSQPLLALVASLVARPDPVPAWRALSPGVEAEVWPYDHYTIVAQHDRIVARATAWSAVTP